MAIGEAKIPCPIHGTRYIHIQQYGPRDERKSEWHICRRQGCEFRRWIRLNLFIIIASAVTFGIYTENALIYTGRI